MRQPTFSRSRRRARQQRLLRAGFVFVLFVVTAAVVAALLPGDEAVSEEELPPTPTVAFVGTFEGHGEERPQRAAVENEGRQILALLDGWFQRAFVDPSLFGDGTFPEVAALFEEAARARFAADVAALTIGEAHEDIARVEPEEATASIAVFFEDGETPRYATAEVRFVAIGTMRDADAYPLRIEQEMTVVLRKTRAGWLVGTYYDAEQHQTSVVPPPTPPSPLESPS